MIVNAQDLIVDVSRPVKSLFDLKTQVPARNKQAYFGALSAFASAHGLRINIKLQDADREWHTTDMVGEQVVAMGGNFRDPTVFNISFLPPIGKLPPPSSLVSQLQSDLRARIGQIPDLKLLLE